MEAEEFDWMYWDGDSWRQVIPWWILGLPE